MTVDAPEAAFPRSLTVAIRLDDNPRYAGTTHDNATARKLGFRAALVPGAFVYGHMSRIAIGAWGLAWAVRGAIGVRFRRPVYNGDGLTVSASALVRDGNGVRCEVIVRNQDSEDVAVGWIGLPDRPLVPPAAADLPIVAHSDPRPEVSAGSMPVGARIGTRNAILTDEDVAASLAAFQETHPFYAETGLVHSGCLMRLAMGDTNQSFRFPAPVVLTSIETQHFAAVHPGARLATSGAIVGSHERKGKHYFDSDEVMIADGVDVVARFRRTQIYA
jgi:acyl dehydratase